MKRKFSIFCLPILTVWILISFCPSSGDPQSPRNPAPVSGFLRDMVVSSQLRGVIVELRGDGLATDFRSFTLAHPPRLAIDFPGVLNSFPKKFLEVDHPLLKDIRLGQHSDKLRIVLTFPATELPPYRIAREAGGLTIIVGKIEKGIEEGMKSEAAEKQEMDGTRMPEGKIPAEPPRPRRPFLLRNSPMKRNQPRRRKNRRPKSRPSRFIPEKGSP